MRIKKNKVCSGWSESFCFLKRENKIKNISYNFRTFAAQIRLCRGENVPAIPAQKI